MPTVSQLWTAPEGSAPMECHETLAAVADGGLRGGICADVVESGTIDVGDELAVVEALDDPDSLAEAIRDRAGER